jgi:hypothetical protein
LGNTKTQKRSFYFCCFHKIFRGLNPRFPNLLFKAYAANEKEVKLTKRLDRLAKNPTPLYHLNHLLARLTKIPQLANSSHGPPSQNTSAS